MIKYYYGYKVDSSGKIYSRRFPDRELFKRVTETGYYDVTLFLDNKNKTVKLHRIIATLFCEKPDDDKVYVVNHKDGNKLNNNYENLE